MPDLFYQVCDKGLKNIYLREVFIEKRGLLRNKTTFKERASEKTVSPYYDGEHGCYRFSPS